MCNSQSKAMVLLRSPNVDHCAPACSVEAALKVIAAYRSCEQAQGQWWVAVGGVVSFFGCSSTGAPLKALASSILSLI